MKFFRLLRHTKGQWAGNPFELLPWQEEHVRRLYGWKRADGTRRYRTAYIEVPKKNGKSTMCAGLALYHLIGDGEAGAEVYSAAADRFQASIVYDEAATMAETSPAITPHVDVIRSQKRIYFPPTHSTFRALSAEVNTKEGLNASAIIFDELHAQKTRELWDTLRYAGASRQQPMLVSITTAGHNRETICYEQHEYAEKVSSGHHPDWEFFSAIYAADPDTDDWTTEAAWKKANPSYGVTLTADSFRSACAEAQAEPRKENAFKRYRLNIWTEQATRWIQTDSWARCSGLATGETPDEWRSRMMRELEGQRCFAALDMSAVRDITALVLVFESDDARLTVLPWFWLPGESAAERERRDRVPYMTWIKGGWIEPQAGATIDQRGVLERILELREKFDIREIAVDSWEAQHMMTLLDEAGVEVVKYGQGFSHMNSPCKDLERHIQRGEIEHGNNPVLNWMAANVAVQQDPQDRIRPSKKHSNERIDGIVALIMALGRVAVWSEEAPDVYSRGGELKCI